MKNWLKISKTVAKVLAGIGAVTWGTITLFNFNLVTKLLGTMPGIVTFVYALVGISGIFVLYDAFSK